MKLKESARLRSVLESNLIGLCIYTLHASSKDNLPAAIEQDATHFHSTLFTFHLPISRSLLPHQAENLQRLNKVLFLVVVARLLA